MAHVSSVPPRQRMRCAPPTRCRRRMDMSADHALSARAGSDSGPGAGGRRPAGVRVVFVVAAAAGFPEAPHRESRRRAASATRPRATRRRSNCPSPFPCRSSRSCRRPDPGPSRRLDRRPRLTHLLVGRAPSRWVESRRRHPMCTGSRDRAGSGARVHRWHYAPSGH